MDTEKKDYGSEPNNLGGNKSYSNEKELEMIQIIKKMFGDLKDLDIGLPMQVLYREIKRKGLYQSDHFIAEKMKKFERMGFIKLDGWNIKEISFP